MATELCHTAGAPFRVERGQRSSTLTHLDPGCAKDSAPPSTVYRSNSLVPFPLDPMVTVITGHTSTWLCDTGSRK